ncbi:MAG: helix-hairpin-helix domain-containing protein [Clostridia bacterium]|nr:helix-hairpin-helix domain-containing protein [Clostridia bacterium]
MRRLRKNKYVVLIICVALVCVLYFIAQKAIDEYTFKTNGDIIREEDGLADNEDGSSGEVSGDGAEEGLDTESGFVADEETDLVLEEADEALDEVEGGVPAGGESGLVNSSGDGSDDESKIYVYITGEVNVPGVVILNENSRIVDAINYAGGTTAKADISKVNLVYVLEDGMKINIPDSDDLKNNPDFEYITMSSGDGASAVSGRGDGVGSSSVGSNGGKGSSGSGFSSGYSVVNINTATQTELESLPGIGPSLALKIINYRNENGKFSSIDEIKNVSGIGDAKFENMKSFITV